MRGLVVGAKCVFIAPCQVGCCGKRKSCCWWTITKKKAEQPLLSGVKLCLALLVSACGDVWMILQKSLCKKDWKSSARNDKSPLQDIVQRAFVMSGAGRRPLNLSDDHDQWQVHRADDQTLSHQYGTRYNGCLRQRHHHHYGNCRNTCRHTGPAW